MRIWYWWVNKNFWNYSQKYNKSFLNIEQDENYLYKSSKHFPIKHNASLVFNNIPYEKHGIYNGLEGFLKNCDEGFDFIFIDVPFIHKIHNYNYNRLQMVEFVDLDLLEDKGYFLIHDTQRIVDANSVNILLSLFQKQYKLKIDYLNNGLPNELTIIKFKKNNHNQKKYFFLIKLCWFFLFNSFYIKNIYSLMINNQQID